jgi:hypothetical protein
MLGFFKASETQKGKHGKNLNQLILVSPSSFLFDP